jgi:N-acyl-D-aspartate/D-glutamate deacylase
MLGSVYPTRFLADCTRGRKLVSPERAVQLMTDVPARLFGLVERGRIAEGWHADLVVYDPAEIGSRPVRTVHDLPADSARLFAGADGIRRVYVGGTPAVVDGEATGELAGTLLRAGRDTAGTALPGS